jgi:ATP-dependent Clp protease ATP-binding subunit ClpB
MTSNAGSLLIKSMGADADRTALRQAVMNELDSYFRPEFLNRLDDVILFTQLTPADIGQIVDIQLKRLRSLLAERRLTLALTPAARAFLAEKGYDPVYGARPLKRVIQRELQDPLALQILEGHVRDGDHIVADVNATGDGLQFTAAATA